MATPTLLQARSHYESQRRIALAALLAVRRDFKANRPLIQIAATVSRYQLASATASARAIAAMDGSATPVANPSAFAGVSSAGFPIVEPIIATIDKVAEAPVEALPANWWSDAQGFMANVEQLIWSEVQDAGRGASQAEMVARPAWSNYVRMLTPPSCARCAILAGRIYRDLEAFQRHPLCDCVMVPVENWQDAHDLGLISSPEAAFERGQIRGLSKADTQAIQDGADIALVVNAYRGLTTATVFGRRVKATTAGTTRRAAWRKANPTRLVRLRPEAIYAEAKDHEDAVRLLRLYGYISDAAPAPGRHRRPDASTPAVVKIQPPTPEPTLLPPAPEPLPALGKVLSDGRRAQPLKGSNGQPLDRDAWENAPFAQADSDFRYIADRADRATGVLQYWRETEVASKQAAENLRAGRDALDGIDVTHADFSHLVDDSYTSEDLAADITATARQLLDWEPTAEHLGTVYRGLQFDPDSMSWDDVKAAIKSNDWKFASTTPRLEHAHWYAGRPDRTRSVIFQISDATGIRLDSVGNHAIEREFLISGRVEIEGFEFQPDPGGYGDRLIVKARYVK